MNKNTPMTGGIFGGLTGTRTPDPLLAKQMLYQLSYQPISENRIIEKDFYRKSWLAPTSWSILPPYEAPRSDGHRR